MPRRLAALLLVPLLAAACDRPARDADAAPAGAEAPADSAEGAYGAPASEIVTVQPVEVEVPGLPAGWEGMRVAVLSDFQLGLWPDNERVARAAAERAAAARPDLVVLLGDYVARGDDHAAIGRVLAPLRGRPMMAVLGNADRVEQPQAPDSGAIRTVEALRAAGVTVLQDARAPFVRNGDTAYVGGVEPYLPRRSEARRLASFGAIPPGPSTVILLAHLPSTAVTIPTGRYPLLLAGGTFCGAVEVPGTARLAFWNTEVFPGTPAPATTRIWRVRGATVFATCGVGYSFVPVRMGHPPEVAMVTLRGLGGAAAADSAAPAPADVDSLIEAFTPGAAPPDSTP